MAQSPQSHHTMETNKTEQQRVVKPPQNNLQMFEKEIKEPDFVIDSASNKQSSYNQASASSPNYASSKAPIREPSVAQSSTTGHQTVAYKPTTGNIAKEGPSHKVEEKEDSGSDYEEDEQYSDDDD